MGLMAALILALDIYAIWSVLQSADSSGNKVLWILLILLFPLIGMLIYFLVGRKDSPTL